MRSPFFSTVLLGAALLLHDLADPHYARCAETPLTIAAVTVGVEGRYKSGYWTPVRIELRCGSQPFRGEIQIVAPDADGVATRFTWRNLPAVELAAGESRTVVRIVKLGRSNGLLSIEAHSGDAVVARRELSVSELPAPLTSEREWIVVYGSEIGISDALGRKSRSGSNTEVCELSTAEQFPEHWLGFEAVDTVVLTTSDRAKIDAISSGQLAALREWVLMGGRLVWSVGKNGRELLGEQGRFADLAPGKFREVSSLRNLSPLETYSGSPQRIEIVVDPAAGIPLTVLTEVGGVVELSDDAAGGSRPLIVRTPLGFGQTVFVGFDLDLPSVANWDGRSRIVARVVQASAGQPERSGGELSNTQVARFGYEDMVGQLRSGLDQFQGVTLVELWWVAGLVFLYIVLIGPVDYFFLRDILRRMTLTWLTFPLVTVAFLGLVMWLGPRWKGSRVLVNQIDLVDVDVATANLRGTTWAHIYSPRAATYGMRSVPQAELASATSLEGNVLAWHGLPGTGLGGLNTAAAAPPAIDEYQLEISSAIDRAGSAPTSQAIQTTLQDVPIHVAATKSVLGRWWGEIKLPGEASLTVDPDGLPRGEVVNPLPVELSDCLVHFGNWGFRLDATRGVLAPGQKTRIELERALNLQWRLTGRRVIESRDIGTPWDQHTLVVPRILEMMMFHSAAGGDSYTQLVNRYQSYVDLSSHLVLGRAVLIGRSQTSAAKLVLDDKEVAADQHWTYYRVIFPVLNPRRS